MKLLFISNYYPPFEIGGYEQLCKEVLDELNNRGYITHVVTNKNSITNHHVDNHIHRIINLEVNPKPFLGTLEYFWGRNKRLEESLVNFDNLARKIDPDFIFIWGMWNLPIEIASHVEKKYHGKVIYYIADYWPSLPDAYTLHWRNPASHWYTRIPKKIIRNLAISKKNTNVRKNLRFENIICVSKAVKNKLSIFDPAFNDAKVIYNGIDIEPYMYSRDSRSTFNKNKIRFLYAGRVSKEKGIEIALNIITELKTRNFNIILTILGRCSPQYKSELNVRIREHNLETNIRWIDYLPREKMPVVYLEHDILLVPSTWEEPLPRIIQEGMAAGLIVVGSEIGGIPEIICDGINGITFPINQPQVAVNKLENIIQKTLLNAKIINNAMKTIQERFTLSRMLDEIECYLNEKNKAYS